MESCVVLDEGHDILRKITPGAKEEVGWEGSRATPWQERHMSWAEFGVGVCHK